MPRHEARDAAVGRYPVLAIVGFQKIIDPRMGDAIAHCVVDEFAAIEAAQPFIGAEPQEAARILANAVDVVVGQAVRRGPGAERQVLGAAGRRNGDNEAKKTAGSHSSSVQLFSIPKMHISVRLTG
jgi:hypothetical protein